MEENNFLKITNITYKILDFLPDADPLKNKAKEKVLIILENMTLVLGLKNKISPRKEKAELELLEDIELLLGYLAVGKGQGWISDVNFLIIAKEYSAIKDSIDILPKRVIEQSDLAPNQPVMDEKKELINQPRQSVVKYNKLSDNRKSIKNQEVALSKVSVRHQKILELLHRKEKARVADFIKELPKITKRTIRRDLDELLKNDKIIRVGKYNQVAYALARE